MNRRLRHAIFWLLVVATGATAAAHWIGRPESGSPVVPISESARARGVAILGTDEWTTFRIPSPAKRIKLLSRAYFGADEATLIDQEFPYEIDYRLESLTSSTVTEGTFSLRTSVIPMVDAAGIPEPAAFFREREHVVATAKVSTLDLAPGEVLILKLRTRNLAPPMTGISVRAFLRQQVPEWRFAYLWNRLSEASLKQIARRRVHDLVDLTIEEKRAILENRWSPLGPQGVAGKGYQERILYVRDDLFPAKRQLLEPLGIGEIRCGKSRRAIIGIPSPGGKLRLEFRRTDDTNSANAATATIRHFGESIHERSTYTHTLDAPLTGFAGEFSAGILEIESPVDANVRPFWEAEGAAETLLEIDPTIIRAWAAGGAGETAVTFPISGDGESGGFFRASVRPVAEENTLVRYTILDAGGATLRSGQCEIFATPSLYDLQLTPDGEIPVNDSVEMILTLPVGAAAIRFESDGEFWLSGFARPTRIPHRTRVPADYDRALPDPDRLPTWFGLGPENADDRIRSHRSALIHSQTRPPEDDADILAGKYQWEDFQPEENALGQYLLSDRDPDSPSRDEALPSLFMELPIGEESTLALASLPGLELPSRRLAFVRDNRDPKILKLFIDGKPFFERELVTGRGELLLPPIPPGSRTFRLESEASGLRCFLNYVQPDKATKLKRLAQRFAPGDALEFVSEKATAEDELLTGMFFAPPDSVGPAEIQVSVRPGEGGEFLPLAETFTLRERVYIVSPDTSVITPVLGGRIPVVDGGRRFFIPFGRDMQPGSYVVTIALRKGPEGYLTLSKVTGGDYSDARFFREASR